jgi:cyclopropane-fatty-acyl-phospholipid synthase
VAGSRRHYDLSNNFFRTFLDDTMAYSSAIFRHPNEPLKAAQHHKFRTIIQKARLQETDHLLEIGCGWGGFAIEAVRQTGCRVTGITISREQYDLARERVRAAGMADRVRILFRDYRRIGGVYDKIVSIEMLEAVGHAHFKTFFRQVDRLLAPEGIAVIQVITIPDQHYDVYRKTHDWIQKHIFPGGLLPSLTAMVHNMTRHTRLMVDHAENSGNHYATTLAHWHRRYTASRGLVSQLGFDRTFQRKWAYYLGSCEAGFRERVLGNLQLVLTREWNSLLKG